MKVICTKPGHSCAEPEAVSLRKEGERRPVGGFSGTVFQTSDRACCALTGRFSMSHSASPSQVDRGRPHQRHYFDILFRTRQRLADAEAALARNEPTTAIILLRVAVDTCVREVVGKSDGHHQAFLRVVMAMARVKNPKRILQIWGVANGITHGHRDGYRDEAERMFRIIYAIGSRWQRIFYSLAGDIAAPASDVRQIKR